MFIRYNIFNFGQVYIYIYIYMRMKEVHQNLRIVYTKLERKLDKILKTNLQADS